MPLWVAADDTTLNEVELLRSWGAQVKLAGGVITEAAFRDSSKLGNKQWQVIGEIRSLKKLTAYGGARGLTDDSVESLLQLTALESLSLDGAQMSDAGLAKLAALSSLKRVSFFHLSFRKPGFTGVGFAAWEKLPHLEALTVAGMSMGDQGFAAIAKIQTLRELRTWHTYRTERSNAMIAKLPALRSLKLGQRLPRRDAPKSLTNDSIAAIATIKTLENLELSEADFAVDALAELKKLPHLKRLKIDRTYLKAEDIRKLEKELPGIKIDFEPLKDDQRVKLENYLR